MDKDLIGDFLGHMHPIQPQTMEGLFGTPSTITPLVVAVSSCYRNRNNEYLDILGIIDDGTMEHQAGYRFFGMGGCLFSVDGRHGMDAQHPLDLVEAVDPDRKAEYKPFPVHRTWIHPLHRNVTFFFKPFNTNTMEVTVGKAYLNRMGFVVKITHNNITTGIDDTPNLLSDSYGVTYDHLGRSHIGAAAMADLAYEIQNYDAFLQSDLIAGHFAPVVEDDDPEFFDPEAHSYRALMDAFLKAVLHAHELGKRVDQNFSFSMIPIAPR